MGTHLTGVSGSLELSLSGSLGGPSLLEERLWDGDLLDQVSGRPQWIVLSSCVCPSPSSFSSCLPCDSIFTPPFRHKNLHSLCSSIFPSTLIASILADTARSPDPLLTSAVGTDVEGAILSR